MKGWLLFASTLLLARAAYEPSVIGSGTPTPAASQSRVATSQADQLPPGVYYAAFWSNKNVIRYYSLTTPTAKYVGRAHH